MNALKEKYNKKVVAEMKKLFGYKNNLSVPTIEKISINVGMNAISKEADFKETVEKVLSRITGQKPVFTKSRLSISNFKIRKGMIIGAKVTLRKNRMWDFLHKLIDVTLPRVKDFRGISPKCLDNVGNCSVGFKEYLPFPEIRSDEVERVHGLQVAIQTTAKDKEKGRTLLKLLGFPFKESDKEAKK
ncbi:50S ribosomal protein L5 [Candidatus Falkowbacteria bacterium]|nr:50S ribosomal protein L5 [Candidatus Falkowbacteria bacterium]